jgi:hypothetical protein
MNIAVTFAAGDCGSGAVPVHVPSHFMVHMEVLPVWSAATM